MGVNDTSELPRTPLRFALPESVWVLVSVCALFAWLFADALFGSGMFVFRDAGHFYYPLFRFIADEWAAGRVPLWNPYENLGQPLAGNPAASVFYPGKLIFALPISYGWAYKIYIMAHLLLAAGAGYRLARHWNASVEAAGVCAISYAFSGNVLFTYCNVVFLVGAAWLPVGLLAADRMLVQGSGAGGQGARSGERGRAFWAVAFGLVLALMVLGGDPQMAYNAALLAAMYALWLWCAENPLSFWERVRVRAKRAVGCVKRTTTAQGNSGQRPSRDPPVRCTHPTHLLRSRPALLALAAATGLVLSAVQVLPSMEFTAHSDRVAGRAGDRLLGRAEPGTHAEHTYHFSVGPWRLAEYVWPNFGGRQFPVHRRWLEVIPAEGRIWTPSLYMGLLPLLLALSAVRLRRGGPRRSAPRQSEPRDRWLSWTVLLAVVASFGWYGLGWLILESRFALTGDAADTWTVGAPFGGLYWLMTLILPGYAYFRYPAKLLVVAALGLSVLSARGWDRVFAGPTDRFRRCLLWLGGLSLCGAVAAAGIRLFWHGRLFRAEADMLFGPIDTAGAAGDLLWAFAQTAVLCGLFWWLLRRAVPGGRWVATVALLLVAADLAVANRWMVACAPASQWERQSKLAAVLEREQSRRNGQGPYRVFRQLRRQRPDQVWMPPSWALSGSPRRLSEAMQWERDTLWPKYNLGDRIPLVEVYGAMMPYDYQVFLSVTKTVPDPLSLAKYVILPGDEVLWPGDAIEAGVQDASLWHNPRHLRRAWIVHQIEELPPLESNDSGPVWRRTEEVLRPLHRPPDLRKVAVVESGDGARPALPPGADTLAAPKAGEVPPDRGESCRLLHYDPLRVEIEAELDRPGLVVLCDQFYPGWKLEVETAGQPPRSTRILRTNRVMRGAWLPKGRHRLTYRYRPASFTWSAIISGLAWAGLVGWAAKRGILLLRGSAGDR